MAGQGLGPDNLKDKDFLKKTDLPDISFTATCCLIPWHVTKLFLWFVNIAHSELLWSYAILFLNTGSAQVTKGLGATKELNDLATEECVIQDIFPRVYIHVICFPYWLGGKISLPVGRWRGSVGLIPDDLGVGSQQPLHILACKFNRQKRTRAPVNGLRE